MVKVITPPPRGVVGTRSLPSLPLDPSIRADRERPLSLPPAVDVRLFREKESKTFGGLPRFVSTTTGASSLSPAVRGVVLASLGGTALIALAPSVHAQELPPTPTPTRAELERAINRLEERRGELSPSELEAERARLWHLYVRAGGLNANVPVPSVSTTDPGTEATLSRGAQRMNRLANDIEFEMRITARDMANGNFVPVEGMPGYKELSSERVRELISDALQDIPLNELPGGHLLVALVKQLPNTSHLELDKMSYREIRRSVGDSQREWLRERFRPILEDHKIEAAVVAFGSITAIRYTSPEAARTLDRILPRIGLYDRPVLDGRARLEADLRYRNAEVLPNLDLRVRADHRLNDRTTARLDAEATLSAEGDHHLSGRITGGVRHTRGAGWVDSSAYVTHTGRHGVEFAAGTSDTATRLNARAHIGAHFGEGVATGPASGRVLYGVDFTRDVEINGARGNFGLYVGGGADTDGKNHDVRAGVVFTLRW